MGVCSIRIQITPYIEFKMVFWTTNMDFKGIVCFPNISAPIETEIPAWGFPFCSSGRQERPTEAPCPPTDVAMPMPDCRA